MPEIRGQSLLLIIQAVDAEIQRLRDLPDDRIVPEQQLQLDDYEILAEELEELYEVARATEPGLPPYDKLVRR